jgi:hypothetical protein
LGCIDTFHGVFYNKIKKLAFKRKIAMKIPKRLHMRVAVL